MKPAVRTQSHFPALHVPHSGRLAFPRFTRALPALTLSMVCALLMWVGMQSLSTTQVVPASAPATEFSAARAMAHLDVIAAAPRDIGSPGYLATQQYLVQQIEAVGLVPEVQATSILVEAEEGAEGFAAATVTNIIARIPGTASTGAIAINAHYDSGATGPGAADAGSGVVTLLETMRAALAGPALQNDLLFVFSDAEEVGMLGAAAFNQQHPLADTVRLAINFEAQGSGGPAILYATSDNSGWLVGEYLDVAPNPTAWSLLPAISKLFPAARLDCDLGEYTDNGAMGLGFVFASDTSAYHTVRDNVDVIDPGSIQQEGDNTLATVRHFGNVDLAQTPEFGERVFFNVAPGVVAHYPAGYVIPLAGLITAFVAGLLVVGLRRGEMKKGGLALGTLAFMLGTLGVVAATGLTWFLIRTFNTDYQVMLIGSYQSTLYAVALSSLTLALMVALYTLLRRRIRPLDLAAGVLLGWLPLLWLLSVATPGMSYLATWPVLFGTLPLAWMLLAGRRAGRPWWQAPVVALAAVPVLVLLPGTMYQMLALFNRFEGIAGLPLFGLSMLFVAPAIGLLVPYLSLGIDSTGLRRWTIPLVAGLLAVVLIGWGNATSGYDAGQPRPDRIAYALDVDSGRAQWVGLDQNLDAWTGQFFPDGIRRGEYDSVLLGTVPAFTSPAPVVPLLGPQVTVVSDSVVNGQRTLRLRLSATDGARMMAVDVTAPRGVSELVIDGHDAVASSIDWVQDGDFPIIYQNVPEAGWELALTTPAGAPVTFVVEQTANGLPEIPGMVVEPRPADMMPAPGHALDPTIVKATFVY